MNMKKIFGLFLLLITGINQMHGAAAAAAAPTSVAETKKGAELSAVLDLREILIQQLIDQAEKLGNDPLFRDTLQELSEHDQRRITPTILRMYPEVLAMLKKLQGNGALLNSSGLVAQASPISGVISPNGQLRAMRSGDRTIIVDIKSSRQLYVIDHEAGSVSGNAGIVWAPNSKLVAISNHNLGKNKGTIIWDLVENKKVLSLEHIAVSECLKWSPDSQYIACWGGGKSGLWSIIKQKDICMYSPEIDPYAWHPDGTLLLINNCTDKNYYIIDPFTGKNVSEAIKARQVEFSPNGKYIALVHPDEANPRDLIPVYELEQGILTNKINSYTSSTYITKFFWTADNKTLIIEQIGNAIIGNTSYPNVPELILWNSQTNSNIVNLPNIRKIACTPNLQFLFVTKANLLFNPDIGWFEILIYIWDVNFANPIHTIEIPELLRDEYISNLSCSHDNNLYITVNKYSINEPKIYVFNIEKAIQEHETLKAPTIDQLELLLELFSAKAPLTLTFKQLKIWCSMPIKLKKTLTHKVNWAEYSKYACIGGIGAAVGWHKHTVQK